MTLQIRVLNLVIIAMAVLSRQKSDEVVHVIKTLWWAATALSERSLCWTARSCDLVLFFLWLPSLTSFLPYHSLNQPFCSRHISTCAVDAASRPLHCYSHYLEVFFQDTTMIPSFIYFKLCLDIAISMKHTLISL